MIAFASDTGVGDMKKTYEKPVLVKVGALSKATAVLKMAISP
jgi:hypothetical protein